MLKTGEIAKVLRVGPQTIRSWRRSGLLPGAIRFGRTIRYPRSAVVRVLNPS
jgi:excisionase family DNA binding protein